MNLETHIFGNFGKGYTQYPDDSKKNIFKNFEKNSKDKTQVTIHRDGNLMYYGYVRKLDKNNYIGLCVVINNRIVKNQKELFTTFEEVIGEIITKGYLIAFDGKSCVACVDKLDEKKYPKEIDYTRSILKEKFGNIETEVLPPKDYSTNIDSELSFTYNDSESEIKKSSYTNGYTFIYKHENHETSSMKSAQSQLEDNKKQIIKLEGEIGKLRRKNRSLRHQQRNTLWVSIVSIIAIILFGIIYVKVINPSEVTKKDMGEYMYYGPIDDGEPNGTGVAIYHDDDKDGRLYYYGNFENGKRIDKNAIMFYKDGSYFKGTMNEDKWIKGLFFDVEKEHFIGEFKKNSPWNGDWYKHVKVQTIVNGE